MSKEAKSGRRSLSELFWGRLIHMDLPSRAALLVFAMVAIASMSFVQLGFWSIGIVDEKPVYLMLILAPVVMGAYLLGPLAATMLGFFSGAVVYAHAKIFPLDYYEVYFMSALNTFVLMTLIGAAAGWLFDLIRRRKFSTGKRVVLVSLTCLGLSLMATLLTMLGTVVMYGGIDSFEMISMLLLNSPLGATIQVLVDAAVMAALCLLADRVIDAVRRGKRASKLLVMFRNWMLLVSAIVFMLASGVIFSSATLQAENDASKSMASEVAYLKKQIEQRDDGDYEDLLDGYDTAIDGAVFITDELGNILASDDENKFVKGQSIFRLLGYGDVGEEDGQDIILDLSSSEDEVECIQSTGPNGVMTMDFAWICLGPFDDGYVGVLYGADMVYKNRFGVMFALTLLAIVLIASIATLATVLLNRVVVRRIDETNSALSRITDGNLDARVNVRDTSEFMSLSAGINKTVGTLRDTIKEVERRNAQDLSTAKIIQESTLPRDFPPFPEIDRFDIYASMKTAKEVGGDFYDFFLVGDSGLAFVIADVSGKGIPAALFMMTAKAQIKNYLDSGLPVDEAVKAANHQLCIGNDAGMFVTMFVCLLDYATGELSYVNAGHNPPLLLHEGNWEWMRDVSGMPLGLFDGIPYESFGRKLDVGDVIYLYTDGVTEAMNIEGTLFGESRLLDTLAEYEQMNPRSVGVGIRRALTDFTKDAEQSDDITMLIMKYGVPPEKKAVMILPAVDTQLVHVYNFIHEELHRRNAPSSVYNPIDIAAEELFVNVCRYAYPGATPEDPGEVRISFEYDAAPPTLTVQIADDGVPYDPLAKPDAVTPENVMDVPIGGLGILMAKRSVDEMHYERDGDSNVVTLVKRW